ncbi:kinase-like domain-containing protein [Penicillium verhagenii]|uniref:kinase-like domain-containing protein n=1 Tax=Penicillium verhagenii TaxID=1562060 RepID=UPI002544F813|nr:kinase-like domain-containing protein [Penicillium verhagenii]KAJ5934877.1 kinase-like domain-containing protein [Penicillium verhagenii]
MTNPYEADPEKIPATDLYADVPFYGRYCPKPDDFHIDHQHVNSSTPESLKYWTSVINLCTEENRIYPADAGGRDVFALGSIIVKSSHLHAHQDVQSPEIDFSYADANETRAIALAKTVLGEVQVPEIFFFGNINSRQVLIQERLPGVGLCVAWPYLSRKQRNCFKEQARRILRQLHTIKPTGNLKASARSHVVPDPNILSNDRINPLEGEIVFSATNHDTDMSFMHNDLTQSNCIVSNDAIVGLIDWEMAGFFGWKTAGEVHRRIRTPQREHFVNANLSEEKLQDMMFWNDLYEESVSEDSPKKTSMSS